MSKSNNGGGSSFPIAGVTALTFTVLKLTHVIDWSWWWVLSPLWITLLIVVAVVLVALVAAAVRS